MSVFWGYGSHDALIRSDLTAASVEFLEKSIGIPRATKIGQPGIRCKVYSGIGHETSMEELDDLKAFIKRHIPGDA